MPYNARIVHSPVFETTLLKRQNHREEHLSTSKMRATRSLLLKQMIVPVEEPESGSKPVVKRAMKRLQNPPSSEKSEYMDTLYLASTSNICEQMFLIAGHALTNRRRSTVFVNFVCQIFLNMNFKFWGIEDIKSIVYDNSEDTMHNKGNN